MKTKVLIIKHDTKAATELRQQLAKNKDICVCDIISDGGNAVSAIRAQIQMSFCWISCCRIWMDWQ